MALDVLRGRRIAVGVGGGIAAYKACELVRELMRAGADVRVSMTQAAQAFVTPLTFQALSNHPVLTHAYDAAQEAGFGHIELARWAELYVLAPATADLLARVRAGMANDGVTSSLLAYRGPVVLAPSMNSAMYENERTQENLDALRAEPRYSVVEPSAGKLACGEVGPGRLADVPDIVAGVAERLGAGPLAGKKVLITAGPTREYLDPVRFISNPSTGRMGLAMAHAARRLGAEVTVVLGPVPEEDRNGLTVVDVVSAEDMAREVLAHLDGMDFLVATAAVSDWRPAERSAQKRKKHEGPEVLELVRTPDVLAEASRRVHAGTRRPVLVGFAAETERVLEHAREKMLRKGLDAIVANDVSAPGAGFAVDTNRVTLLTRQGAQVELEGSKRDVAVRLWEHLATNLAPTLPSPSGRGTG
ncbi:MAG: bifunctional phosphopantothenoylcysteine decarboxylase/phosphopantothenate--cysteine ligase CoaBC [Myxococcaceae bacterium]|nr:bifunctional phosphopantothenoylcysteine decarboxylase/phosphopantothenate--cysteine ligase CoaBC [Myxococcaceae bacterium]MCI0670451.1 bifunctional phosphopantothenoylcysteine decarboxylase/phosphopantothenate--cysteine ligase CoaBC [Myxococcaceae bacterium]